MMPAMKSSLKWAVKMNWHELLFAHWPVSCDEIRPLVPKSLRLDKYDGRAWVGVVPFRMTGIRLRHLPPMPLTSSFYELNVRTYVRDENDRGVWFISLDASSRMAVTIARRWYHLNYQAAQMAWVSEPSGVSVESHRCGSSAAFAARYGPKGNASEPDPGALEHFLTERYALWAEDGTGQLYKSRVDHAPWRLQEAEVDFQDNSMLAAAGLKMPTVCPHLRYAHGVEAVIESPKRVQVA